ncbi:MAG TPA: pyruvate dehydrogenase (acetyl-transferring) E1 component subunit alpha [Terrimesophilobacter sp.]|nr:pyruvate dehydrogenase (acetyl-transferring) E1 component subunit alpha [Terrimesophilobacter sp.]
MARSTAAPDMNATDILSEGDFIQLIDPLGSRVANPTFDPLVADIDDARLLGFYEDMVVVRRIDSEATALQRQGQLALWAPLLGQEAAQIGSARVLEADDFVFPSYRENAVAYCRGVEPHDLLRMWRGTSHGGWDPAKVGMALPAIIIGAQALHAVGYALGVKNEGAPGATITYFGDGATSQGDINEAMIFAASFQVPVVLFCQNNHWAISEPVSVQANRAIADRAPGFGIPSLRVDGNDVLAVLAATRQAMERARSGGGPTFIEAVTYRMGPHTTSDDPSRYRSKEELEEWAAKDPILRVERLLEASGALTEEARATVQAKADEVAASLRAAVIGSEKRKPLELFEHVYSSPHPRVHGQRERFASYLEMYGEGH